MSKAERPVPLAPPNPAIPMYVPDNRTLWPAWGVPDDEPVTVPALPAGGTV